MPSIPQSKRLVQDQVFQRPNTSTQGPRVGQVDKSAARFGQSLEKVNNVYNDFRDKADKIELDGFKTRLREKQNQLTHDRDEGFLNVRGKDTVTRSDEFIKNYDDFADGEIEALGSDRVKAIATQMKNELKVGYNKQLMSHTSREMEVYDNEQTKANLTSVRDHAILNYQTSPEKIGESIEEQKQLLSEFAERKGMSAEQKALMLTEAESETHSGVIYQAIADDNDLLAGEYFKQARKDGKLTAEDTLRLEKAVDQASRIGESQRITSDLMGKGLSQTDALAKAREIKEPKLKDETVRRIKNRYAEQKNISEMQRTEMFEGMAVLAEQQGLDKAKKDPRWFDLKASHRSAIEGRARQVARGETPTTDLPTFDMLNTLAATPETRNKFLRTPLTMYQHKLAPGDFKKFSDLQRTLRKGQTDKADGIFTNNQIAKDAMKELGVTGDRNEAQFRAALQDRTIEWERQHNKPITSDDIKKIANELGTEVVTDKGFIWDTTTPKYKLSDEQVNALTIDDVPRQDYDQIVDVLNKQGLEVSSDEILKRYKRVRLGFNG